MQLLNATSIAETLRTNPPNSLVEWRRLRRGWSRSLRSVSPQTVVEVALGVMDSGRWGRLTAYELIACHPTAVRALSLHSVRALGLGIADWGTVDAFAVYVAGPAWRERRIPTQVVHRWLRSSDRWIRRTAVVCTVALNVRARGGTGDVARTLNVCRRVIADRDDIVVKALSWALRSLVRWDPAAVAGFLAAHESALAARVKREVRTKLRTGRKNE